MCSTLIEHPRHTARFWFDTMKNDTMQHNKINGKIMNGSEKAVTQRQKSIVKTYTKHFSTINRPNPWDGCLYAHTYNSSLWLGNLNRTRSDTHFGLSKVRTHLRNCCIFRINSNQPQCLLHMTELCPW